MSTLLCTFNANNLFVRYRFGETFPGDVSRKSLVSVPGWGYLPPYDPDFFELFNDAQRNLAARAITNEYTDFPDILCLQEVESMIALRAFNEGFLRNRYRHAALIDSRDFRQIDVGVLSRLPILNIRSHVDDKDPAGTAKSPWLFSRDCLEVDIALNPSGSRRLTLFINHLKSKLVDWRTANTPAKRVQARKRADDLRTRQAQQAANIIKARFAGSEFTSAFFAIVGDLNDQPTSPFLAPLFSAGLVDAFKKITKEEDRWTHWLRGGNTVSQLDHILLSPALANAVGNAPPRIERRGIGYERILSDGATGPKETRFERVEAAPNPKRVSFQFDRFAEVSPDDYASDHCPVFVTIP